VDTIVVVDDDQSFGQLLSRMLGMEGYRAVVVTTPEEVVPTVREEEPVLVLMDIYIRNEDTLGTLRDLKGEESLRNTPVIMVSGMDRAEECLQSGADRFLLKPFRPSELFDQISELIGQVQG
jgi:DNA-binding response OmpR family regulator